MAIPKIIHYCWFGNANKPQSVEKCISSWRKYCPDYEIKEWSEANFDVNQNQYCQQAYEEKAWGFVPDYIRLWIIYHEGGIYLDTDVQILKSFDSLLDNKAFAGFEYGTADKKDGYFVNFGQGFGAEPGNKIILNHMNMYNDLQYRLQNGEYNRVASPNYTTDILVKHGLERKQNKIQKLDGMTIYPTEYFCPKNFSTGVVKKTQNTYSIHHFDGSWYSEEEQRQREEWIKAARADYWRHWPNRFIRKVFGEELIEKIKQKIKK